MLNRSLKKFLSLFIATLVLFGSISIPQHDTVAATSFKFTDVPFTTDDDATWYSNAIYKLLDAGVITPTTDGKFNPAGSITGTKVANLMFNAMKVALIEKEASQTVKNEITNWDIFGDVPTDFWAYPYMRSYYNFFNKEMNSVNISREQFALAMVGVKRLDYSNEDGRVFVKDPILYDNAALNEYTDNYKVDETGNYVLSTDGKKIYEYKGNNIYQYYVELCLEKGVIGSVDNNIKILNPAGIVTNAMAAQFIYNVLYAENADHTPKVTNNFVKPTTGNIIAPSITAIQRNINVGIMILDTINSEQNPDFEFFMKLDNNINKPMDWNIVNPNTAKNTGANTDMYLKSDKRYWEVYLNVSDAQNLADNYDILFQTSHKEIKLTQQNSNMIKDFITKGGQMWWEDCDGMSIKEYNSSNILTNTNFLGIGFAKNQSITSGQKRYDQVAYEATNVHPLLDSIFKLSPTSSTRADSNSYSFHNNEISSLGDLDEYYQQYRKVTAYITGLTLDVNGKPKYTKSTMTDSLGTSHNVSTDIIVKNIDNNSTNNEFFPSAAVSSIGKGRLIVTANDVACGICDVGSGGGNGVEDFKFSYNLIGWTGRAAVDFREMEGKTWEVINPSKMELTTTISNFGGREQDYLVVPQIIAGEWELTTPTITYTTSTSGPITELYGIGDGLKTGYPKIIKLEPNESIKITYTLKAIGTLKAATYSINVKVCAVDNATRDTDNAPYSLTVNSLQLNDPTLSYHVVDEIIDSNTNYCIASNIELTIPSPLIIGEGVPTGGYTYKFYFNGYLGNDISTGKKLDSVLTYPGTTYAEKIEIKDTFMLAAVKNPADTRLTDGVSETQIGGVSVGVDTCQVDDSGETCKGYGMLVVTIPDVKFTNINQKLKAKIFIDGLSNKNKYIISGYVHRQQDDKDSNVVSTNFVVNQSFNTPRISVSRILRQNNTYTAILKCITPLYTDGDSTPKVEIKDKDNNILQSAFLSEPTDEEDGTETSDITFTGLALNEPLFAEITVVSTPLNTEHTVKIPLLVDIN